MTRGAPYCGHYSPARAETLTTCHGCERTLRAGQPCWADNRAPGALLCGRCVTPDPAWTTRPGKRSEATMHAPVVGQMTLGEAL